MFKEFKNLPNIIGYHSGLQNIAIDAGSTATRGVIVANDDVNLPDISHISEVEMCELLSIPSGYTILSPDTPKGTPTKYDSIYDKLEYLVVKESGGDLGWTQQRVVKGSLMEAYATTVTKVAASLLKIEQEQTVTNILVTIANMFLSKTLSTGKGFKGVMSVDLSLALPYEDINASAALANFKKKLSGVYKVIFPRLPFTVVNDEGKPIDKDGNVVEESGNQPLKMPYLVKFEITESRIHISSEQKAVAEYYEAAFSDDIEYEAAVLGERPKTVIIEVGGRNTAMILNKASGMDDSLQMTFDDGGHRILQQICESAIRKFNLTSVSEEQALKVFITGSMNYGGKTLDCTDILNSAKQDFARILFNNYALFLQSHKLKLNSVKHIIVSGRSFLSVEKKVGDSSEVISPSLKNYLQGFLGDNEIDITPIGVDYPIPWGLVTLRLSMTDEDFNFDLDFDVDLDF